MCVCTEFVHLILLWQEMEQQWEKRPGAQTHNNMGSTHTHTHTHTHTLCRFILALAVGLWQVWERHDCSATFTHADHQGMRLQAWFAVDKCSSHTPRCTHMYKHTHTHTHTHLCWTKRNSMSVLLAIHQNEITGSVINRGNKAHTAVQPWCSPDITCEISSPFKPGRESERSFSLMAGGEVPHVGCKAKVTARRGPIFSTQTRSRWLLQRCCNSTADFPLRWWSTQQ